MLDPEQLAGKSVAVKDLQALERLLFQVQRDAYTCGFAGAIARCQSGLAEEILHEWTKKGGFRQAAMRQYAGSVSFGASGGYVAASHPHEDVVSLWATHPAGLMAVAELADTCGIAGCSGAGAFIATGAGGRIARIDARTGESTVLVGSEGSHWDNHLLALGART